MSTGFRPLRLTSTVTCDSSFDKARKVSLLDAERAGDSLVAAYAWCASIDSCRPWRCCPIDAPNDVDIRAKDEKKTSIVVFIPTLNCNDRGVSDGWHLPRRVGEVIAVLMEL